MGGILKNPLSPQEVTQKQENESVSEFRKQVYKNTQLNAKLTAGNGIDSLNAPFAGDRIVPGGGNGEGVTTVNSLHPDDSNSETPVIGRRRSSSSSSHGFPPKDSLQMKLDEEERLQWNKRNLEENEITKQQFQDIHVDEPKTPYQGAVDPEGEYYRDDDEEDDDDNNNEGPSGIPPLPNDAELDDFTLGEPEYAIDDSEEKSAKVNETHDVHMADDPVQSNEDEEDEEELDEEAAKALKHKKFEEMRKKHYNLREMFKNRRNHPPEDEDEDEDEN